VGRKSLGALLAVAAGLLGLRAVGAFRFEVRGASMRPTLQPGDWLLAVRASSVRRGDIVVVAHPERGFEIVKRVVGLPGERVETDGGSVRVDGRPLREPYAGGRGAAGAWDVGSGSVVLLGDDRSVSSDSRSFGPVPVHAIAGRAVLRYWPRPRLLPLPAVTAR
jgi:signal peptidase I